MVPLPTLAVWKNVLPTVAQDKAVEYVQGRVNCKTDKGNIPRHNVKAQSVYWRPTKRDQQDTVTSHGHQEKAKRRDTHHGKRVGNDRSSLDIGLHGLVRMEYASIE